MKYSLRKTFSSQHRKQIDDIDLKNSNSNLIKTKKFLRKKRRSSSTSSLEQNKSKVFEPRYDIHSSDDDDADDHHHHHLFSSSTKFHRLTQQIRRSFRNTLRQSSKINNEKTISILPSTISIGLTSPLINQNKQKTTEINQSILLPIEEDKTNFHRSFSTRFSFLRKQSFQTTTSLTQRFHSLRHSFHFGYRNSSNKGQHHLLSNE